MLTAQLKTQIKTIHQAIKLGLPGYQARPSQNKLVAEMANIIAGSFHSYDRIGLIEAGTGTGKSLAYLLAAIPIALEKQKTLVIATATVALQEQLVLKDLPFFQQHCHLPFEFTLVKGRQRYACIERLRQYILQPEFSFSQEQGAPAQLATLLEHWQQRTWLGDRDTLPFAIPDALWQSIQADGYLCHQAHQVHRECPFHLARAEIETSQVLVVNHALLLADLASGHHILPAPEDCIYVIDEAHHLADCGRDLLAAECLLSLDIAFWRAKVEQFCQQLPTLVKHNGILKETQKLIDHAQDFFNQLQPLQRALRSEDVLKQQPHHRFVEAQLPALFERQAEPLAQSSTQILNALEKLFQLLSEQWQAGKQLHKTLWPLQHELSGLEHKFASQQKLWQLWAVPQDKHVTQARWLSAQQQHISAHACPLSVSFQLDDLLFAKAHAVLLCSATLTSLNSFDYAKRELGLLDHPGLREIQVSSPFAYAERGLLLIPNLATEPSSAAFTDELIQVLPQYLEPEQGNLVLFASYWQMEQVANALRPLGWSLLVQGEASRQALLDLHKMKIQGGQGSILFGTQSFSEGLDLPGALLTNLVITKLPFAVPTSPFEEAMAEAVAKKGGNPFLQLTVPAAAKKLVQACGRLLRQEQDHGRIVILDRRLVTKSYGSAMLRALPPFQQQIDG